MESLVELESLSSDEIMAMMRKMFEKERREKIINYSTRESEDLDETLATFLNYAAEYKDFSGIKDNGLKNAIAHLYRFSQKTGAMFDIHEGNIMARRGPTGLHLVFSDPFSGERKKS